MTQSEALAAMIERWRGRSYAFKTPTDCADELTSQLSETTRSEQKLRELIAEWRKNASFWRNDDYRSHPPHRRIATTYDECADELEAETQQSEPTRDVPLAKAGEPTVNEALELMVRELKWYASKYGLGPAKLQYALSQGERALAAAGQAAKDGK